MIRRGTIGSHRYYCISFRRHHPELIMLVADRQVNTIWMLPACHQFGYNLPATSFIVMCFLVP